MKHELNIPETVISAAAMILRQYAPEITTDYLKTAIVQYHHEGDSTGTQGVIQRKLTRAEAAQILGISMNTIHRYINAGFLKVVKMGPRLVRVDPASVQALLDHGIPSDEELKK